MKCRLCERPTAAGTGKLCADCAKALQRARGAALSKLPPSAAAEPARPITLTIPPAPATERRSHGPLLWVGVGVAAIALVYFAEELMAPRGAEAPGTNRTSPPAMTERVNVEPAPVVTRVEEPSWTTVGDSTKASGGADQPQSPAAPGSKPVVAVGAKTGTKTAKAASQEPKSLPAPAEHEVTAPKPDPERQQQLAKVVAPAEPVDGAQALASAMQKCGNEGLFSKFICEQKTYLQYCEDKWDKHPKCMRKVGEK